MKFKRPKRTHDPRVPEGYELVPAANPRTVKMTPEVRAAMEQQLQRFRDKFGREPGPDDPVFFDPDADTPQIYPPHKLTEEMATAMRKVGIDEAIIYAYQKTGILLTQSNQNQWNEADLEEYRQAIEEYRQGLQ